MDVDEPMQTDDFYGQPESDVKSDLDVPMETSDLDKANPAQMRQPSTVFDMIRGFRKEPGHPKFPWHRLVEQRADGLITVRLERWKDCEELPPVDMRKMPFAFPFDIAEIKKGIEDPVKLAEWNDIIAQSLALPMFIYTPTLFAALMAAPEKAEPEEKHWMPPIVLATTVMRAYSQILFFLSNNKSLVPMARRKDIMRSAGVMFKKRIDLISKILIQNPRFLELLNANVSDEKYDPVFQTLAETFAGHTVVYIKIMESTILRLCDMDPNTEVHLRKLLLESAIPDPEAERILPFSSQLLDDWRNHNIMYVNRLFTIRGQQPPLVNENLNKSGRVPDGAIHLMQYNVRGVNKQAMWHILKRVADEYGVNK